MTTSLPQPLLSNTIACCLRVGLGLAHHFPISHTPLSSDWLLHAILQPIGFILN